jgi:hypothetical protein
MISNPKGFPRRRVLRHISRARLNFDTMKAIIVWLGATQNQKWKIRFRRVQYARVAHGAGAVVTSPTIKLRAVSVDQETIIVPVAELQKRSLDSATFPSIRRAHHPLSTSKICDGGYKTLTED